jgi:recombination protein RecT
MSNINNSLTNKTEKPRFSVAIQSEQYQQMIKNTLKDKKRSSNYIAGIMSAVAVNPALQECDASTVLSASLLGESLGLSHSPAMGQYFMVPYNDNKSGRKVATFQLGYKGYILLAMKSGQYKRLNVVSIKKGEFKGFNPITEEIDAEFIQDFDEREKAETVGYYAYFELNNGFKKAMYWTKDKMEAHATRYSQAYRNKYGNSFWLGDGFETMAYKTLLRQLISKWGIMSTEFQQAYEADMAVIKEDGTKDYVDNDNSDVQDIGNNEQVQSE